MCITVDTDREGRVPLEVREVVFAVIVQGGQDVLGSVVEVALEEDGLQFDAEVPVTLARVEHRVGLVVVRVDEFRTVDIPQSLVSSLLATLANSLATVVIGGH
jgi:hypothetical protein